MPRKSNSVYARTATDPEDSPDNASAEAANNTTATEAPRATNTPRTVTPAPRILGRPEDIFRLMTDQMQLLTDGLAVTRSEVGVQRAELDTAREDLRGARAALGDSRADLARARANQHVIQQQYVASDPGYPFNRNGNREQFRFNVGVLNAVTEAATALEEDRIPEARQFIRQGTTAIIRRNKHIKLADASSVGWAFIEEYTQSDLADNEEDDRRIRRSEAAAIAKKKQKTESNQRGKGQGKGQQGKRGAEVLHSDTGVNPDPLSWFLQSAAQAAQSVSTAAAAAAPQAATAVVPAAPFSSKKPLGPCYYCGGPHLQAQCPLWKQQQAILQAHQAQLDNADNGQNAKK
jgi:hypothetical protein